MSWNIITVGSLIERGEAEVKTGPFGTQLRASDYVEQGTPVINVRNIGFGSIRPDKLEYIPEEVVARLSGHLLRKGDIVFGRKGAVERHVYIKSGQDRWFQGSDCLRLRVHSEKSVLSKYLSFTFLTHEHQSWMMQQCSHGATMASLNQDIIKRIPVRLPPIDQQRVIVDVLSAYDDLIDNNSRRIEILEEMARRFYEEWFVHFRFHGHEGVSFKESELGRIPEGWKVQELADVAQVNPEAIKPKSAPDEIHYIDIASVSPGQIEKAETMQFSNAPGRARRIVRSGDVLWSCVRPNRRSCAMIIKPRKDTVASTGFAVLRAKSISDHYLYQYVRADKFVSYLVNRATGAAYPAVKAADFKEAKIIVPESALLSAFDEAVAPMRSLIHRLERKNANLRTQRDLLLPKLVSGEIDVADIPMPDDMEVEAA